MYKLIIIYLFIGLIAMDGLAQNNKWNDIYRISCTLTNYKDFKKAYLYDYSQGKYNLMDTAIVKDGSFEFNLDRTNHSGIYKIRLSPDKVIENIIFNFEDIELKADYNNLTESLKYTKSVDNIILHEYNTFLQLQSTKENTLKYLLKLYGAEEKFHTDIKSELKRLTEINKFTIDKIKEKEPITIATKFINYEQIPLPGDTTTIIRQYLMEHFWDNIDFNDTLLIYFPLYLSKIGDYFSLFEHPDLAVEEQEERFRIAADIILERASVNPTIYSYTFENILIKLESFNLIDLYNYVAEKYNDAISCINEEKAAELKLKIEKNEVLGIGQKAPDFQITSKLNLWKIKSTNTLLVFWDSKCQHCYKTLFEIQALYDASKKSNLEVIGISIDTNSLAFKIAILERGYRWINVCDFQGWNSLIITQYNITSTPSMILLDKNKKIIARPINVNQLMKKIKKAG